MDIQEFQEKVIWLRQNNACINALTWINQHSHLSVQEIWDRCDTFDWLLWAILRSKVRYNCSILEYRKKIVLLGVEVVREVLDLIPEKYQSFKKTVDNIEQWARDSNNKSDFLEGIAEPAISYERRDIIRNATAGLRYASASVMHLLTCCSLANDCYICSVITDTISAKISSKQENNSSEYYSNLIRKHFPLCPI